LTRQPLLRSSVTFSTIRKAEARSSSPLIIWTR
jgi:hypothetical protein